MLSSTTILTKLEGIAQLAKGAPDMVFTSLAHNIDIDWLKEAYRRTRKDGAFGVDGQTASDYEAQLESNLQSLLDRAKSGTYRAPPVRRVHILKGSGPETRSIGIPTLEDKILQRAVTMVLEAVYEQDFLASSYGFRPGRNAHQMLQAFWEQTMAMKGCYVLEIDIRKFFDTLDHSHFREILRRRVCDGVLTRLIGKLLKAGVFENKQITYPTAGTPQGGPISPLLSNIFLHDVLDDWFEKEVKRRLSGESHLYRFADDAIMLFDNEKDAQKVLDVLHKRLRRYGLELHPEKTRLIRFFPKKVGKGESFSLLGFTHFWGKSRRGNTVVQRKTDKTRFSAALKRIGQWCERARHWRIIEQHRLLSLKLKGHYSYYGITGNFHAINRFRYEVGLLWRKWLSRRSDKAKQSWDWFNDLLKKYPLPPATVVHSVLSHAAKI